MTDGEQLLGAILDVPADDAPRLVYADWLDEHGDADRAEFIRLGVRAEGLLPDAPDRTAVLRRLRGLERAGAEPWTGGPRAEGLGQSLTFRRGFVDSVSWWDPDNQAGWDRLRAVCRGHPVRHLRITWSKDGRPPDVCGRLAGGPEFRTLETLRIPVPDGAAGPDLDRLGRCPHLGRLSDLHLSALVSAPDLRRLLGTPLGGRLTAFGLSFADDAEDTCRLLAGSPAGGRLTALNLGNELTNAGLAAALQAGTLPALRSLTIEGHLLSAGAVGSFAGWRGRLERFALYRGWDLPDAALGEILAAPASTGVTSLGLWFCPGLGERTVTALSREVRSVPLRELTLAGEALQNGHVAQLIESSDLTALEDLTLSNWTPSDPGGLTDDAARAIARARGLDRFRCLSLRGQAVGPDGAAALARSPATAQLRSLELSQNPIGDCGAAAIAGAAFLRTVESLRLDRCGVGDVGARALLGADFPALTNLWLSADTLSPDTQAALRGRFGDALVLC
jgi:uncharacterized protein (TIGR02996 family)